VEVEAPMVEVEVVLGTRSDAKRCVAVLEQQLRHTRKGGHQVAGAACRRCCQRLRSERKRTR
jgi:hypothetical protein